MTTYSVNKIGYAIPLVRSKGLLRRDHTGTLLLLKCIRFIMRNAYVGESARNYYGGKGLIEIQRSGNSAPVGIINNKRESFYQYSEKKIDNFLHSWAKDYFIYLSSIIFFSATHNSYSSISIAVIK
jgi:hypothetical protein